jgi:hypothetical protein
MLEGVLGIILSWTDVGTLIGIVGASELVTVNDAEDTVVDVEVHTEVEIGPVVVARAVGLAELSTLQEDALRDAGVGDARLNDVESVIIEVEIDDALSNAEVLCRVLDNGFKEVRLEVEDLTIVLQPFGCNSRDGVVLLLGTTGNTGEVSRGTSLH